MFGSLPQPPIAQTLVPRRGVGQRRPERFIASAPSLLQGRGILVTVLQPAIPLPLEFPAVRFGQSGRNARPEAAERILVGDLDHGDARVFAAFQTAVRIVTGQVVAAELLQLFAHAGLEVQQVFVVAHRVRQILGDEALLFGHGAAHVQVQVHVDPAAVQLVQKVVLPVHLLRIERAAAVHDRPPDAARRGRCVVVVHADAVDSELGQVRRDFLRVLAGGKIRPETSVHAPDLQPGRIRGEPPVADSNETVGAGRVWRQMRQVGDGRRCVVAGDHKRKPFGSHSGQGRQQDEQQ